MTDQRVPVETPCGYLYGRDCIFLDAKQADRTAGTLTLLGEFNGNLCEPPANDRYVPYTIQFFGVVTYKVEDQDLSSWDWDSSFEEVINSTWAGILQSQSNAPLRYFTFQTYDDLFHIVCGGYRLLLKQPAA